MKAAVLYGKKDVRIEEVLLPKPGPRDVLVRIKAVGICGSDIHYYEHFGMGESYQLTEPQILGHEAAGVVADVGKEVKNLAPGDRVTIEPGEACFSCRWCKEGHYNLCPDVKFLSTPFNKGAFAEYLVMRSDLVFKIPDTMSYEVASLAEPLSVGIHACELVEARPGKSLLILGAGPIGLMALAAARSFGATDITVCDIQDNRLQLAKGYGAAHIWNSTKEQPGDMLEKYGEVEGFDCCIETAGTGITQDLSISLTKKGGMIAFVGIPRETHVKLDVFDIIDKELSIKGVFRYANSYPAAVKILSGNIVDFTSLITKTFPLEKTGEALRFALEEKMTSVKTVVVN